MINTEIGCGIEEQERVTEAVLGCKSHTEQKF